MDKENGRLIALGKKMEDIGSREISPRVWKPFMLFTLAVTTAAWGVEFYQGGSLLTRAVDANTTRLMLEQAQQSMAFAATAFGALMSEMGTIAIGVWSRGGTEAFEKNPLVVSTTLVAIGKRLQHTPPGQQIAS